MSAAIGAGSYMLPCPAGCGTQLAVTFKIRRASVALAGEFGVRIDMDDVDHVCPPGPGGGEPLPATGTDGATL